MNENQLKNLYYDLVDGNKDNDDNIKELLTKAKVKDIVIEKNKILFNFRNKIAFEKQGSLLAFFICSYYINFLLRQYCLIYA